MTQLISTFPALPLTYQCRVVWEARDPVTGDLVSGVVITDPVLYGVNLTPGADGSPEPEAVAPLFVPVQIETSGPGE